MTPRRTALALALLLAALSPMSLSVSAQSQATGAAASEPDPATPEGDPTSADYWRHCSIDGFPAAACGGTASSCPPGTVMSPIAWIRNPVDGKDYILSYNDCCGKGPCGQAFAHRNEGDKPVYYPQKSNDIGWCMGPADAVYNSTVSIVIGVEEGEAP